MKSTGLTVKRSGAVGTQCCRRPGIRSGQQGKEPFLQTY